MSSGPLQIGCLGLGRMGRPEPDIAKLHATRTGRTCAYTTCTTRLSVYNPGDYCSIHEHHEQHRVLPDGTLRPKDRA